MLEDINYTLEVVEVAEPVIIVVAHQSRKTIHKSQLIEHLLEQLSHYGTIVTGAVAVSSSAVVGGSRASNNFKFAS